MPRELLMMQNSFEWEAREGQTLQLDNAIKSNARGLKIEGQTYQNLLSETKNLRQFVYDDITGEYTLTNPTVGEWSSMSINYTRPIQAGEKLLIRINIVKNTIEATGVTPVKIIFSDGGTISTGFINIENGVTGLLEYYCDGASITEHYKNIFEIATREYTSGELIIKDIQVIPVNSNPLSYTDNTKEYVSTKSEFNYIYIFSNLKANTTYTLGYEIKSSNKITTNDMSHLFRVENEKSDSTTNIVAGFTGTVDNIYRKYKLTFNTGTNTVRTKINLRNQFNASSIGLAENTLSVRNLVLLEGDYTNKAMITELPTTINGIESVAEREFEQNLYTEGDLNVKGKYAWMNTRKTINCKPNTNYTFSCNIESVNKGDYNANPFVEVYTNEKIYENRNVRLNEPGSASFTTNNEAKQLIIYFFVNNETYSSTECEANFKDIELYESDLYSVKINQYNHNYLTHEVTLLDNTTNSIETINGILYYVQNIGKIVLDGTQPLVYHGFTNDTYICATYTDNLFDSVNNNSIYVEGEYKAVSDYIMDENSTTCGFNNRMAHNKGIFMRFPKSEVGVNIGQLNNYLKANNHIVYYKLAEPIYIPSNNTNINLPQPLRSLPDGVRDTVEGNKLVQRVGMVVFDGSTDEDWKFESLNTNENGLLNIYIVIPNAVNKSQYVQSLLCDKFPQQKLPISDTTTEGVLITNQKKICLRLYQTNASTVDEAKNYLSTNPITVYYELAEPIVHDLTIPTIKLNKGENIVTTINNIQPNLKFKYKKSEK